ncbi:MAG: hypothetical protein V3U16_07520 [Candidatus Neomarinimicrobiota bacterium]
MSTSLIFTVRLTEVFILCIIFSVVIARDAPEAKKNLSAMLRRHLKRSNIALMPAIPDDINTYRPLHPSVVAWGIDSLGSLDNPQRLKNLSRDYNALGIKLQACNVWLLTASARVLYRKPEYQNAVCVDIAGGRIVPPWQDYTFRGVKNYWCCTNHPLFQKQLIKRAQVGIASGANMLHLDDHLGTAAAAGQAGGCFCEFCMTGFNDWLESNFSRGELLKKGIFSIRNFNYHEVVREANFSTLAEYKKGFSQKKIPLQNEFITFQQDAVGEFIKYLGKIAARIAKHPIPVGINAVNLSPFTLVNSHYADYFANEVTHYDQEDTIPPMVYLLGTALDKPVFSTGQGHCWIKVQRYNDVTRVRQWIATAYAFGHYFLYAYKQWGFSKETGTQWHRTPLSTYEPLCRFITENADMFDDYEPVVQVGVLYNNSACRNDHWEVREVCRALHYANIPCGLAVAGDKWLRHQLSQKELEQFELVVIPKHSNPMGKQTAVLEQWKKHNEVMAWSNTDEVRSYLRPLVSLKNGDKVWTLPRRIPGQPGAPVVIHLLNRDYNAQKDTMRVKSSIELSLSRTLTDNRPVKIVTLFTPDTKPKILDVRHGRDDIIVTIPILDLWAILKIE